MVHKEEYFTSANKGLKTTQWLKECRNIRNNLSDVFLLINHNSMNKYSEISKYIN